jgi:hypothetical protein
MVQGSLPGGLSDAQWCHNLPEHNSLSAINSSQIRVAPDGPADKPAGRL